MFFCLGVYTGAVDNNLFKLITVDYTKSIASTVKQYSPNVQFLFLSGAGADLTESSRTSFARFKGMAENFLMNLNFKQLSIFRPGYIYPVTKRNEPNLMYSLSRALYPLLKLMGNKYSIRSTELAKAIFLASKRSPSKLILENDDILKFLNSTTAQK